MDELRRAGVVSMNSDFGRFWGQDIGRLLEVVRAHQTGNSGYQRIAPVGTQNGLDAIRADLVGASSFLGDFVKTIQKNLSGACAVFIPRLGFESLDVNSRAVLAYALSACLGNPTATDAKQVVWDVKARKRDSTYFSTFSETNSEADFHTDTQYYPAPEQTFLLYCMVPAACGGGLSSICDARALRQDIETEEKWISDVLSDRLLPFRVPSAFVTEGGADTVQATLAPVFADAPLIRYRRDTLAEGLLHFPEHADADAHRALDAFEQHLAATAHRAEFFMPRDSLVVVDNHRALHARTAFQDPERHLLRIRLGWENAQPHQGRYRMVTGTNRALLAEMD
jgi:alpha-ketoglutarate-dependent taurine dioxygenase